MSQVLPLIPEDRTLRSATDLARAGLVAPERLEALSRVAERYAVAVTPDVAELISAQEYEEFKAWQAQKKRPTLAEQFDEIRALLAARGEDGIELPPRTTRYNPMVDDPHYWD